MSKDPQLQGHVFFRTCLLNISTGEKINRIWEMKGNHLLSEQKLSQNYSFTKNPSMMAEWWQEIARKGLNRKDNSSLDKAILALMEQLNRKTKMIVISDCKCRFRGQTPKIWYIEYRLKLEIILANDEVYMLGGTVIVNQDFSEATVIDFESFSVETNELSMSKKDREDLILTIRNKILEDKVLVDIGHTVIDYYNIREIDMDLKSEYYKAKLDFLLVN